jgi:hypothetical protein
MACSVDHTMPLLSICLGLLKFLKTLAAPVRTAKQATTIKQQAQRLEEYQYGGLNGPLPEIRLVSILPGNPNDEICIEIEHVPFDPMILRRDDEDIEPEPLWKRLPQEFRRGLPDGWSVNITMDGRFLFSNLKFFEDHDECTTIWDFPAPDLAEKL